MGDVIRLFPDGVEAAEMLKAEIERGNVGSFVICAILKNNTVASAIHMPDRDLYSLIGLLEAVKSELVSRHEHRE